LTRGSESASLYFNPSFLDWALTWTTHLLTFFREVLLEAFLDFRTRLTLGEADFTRLGVRVFRTRLALGEADFRALGILLEQEKIFNFFLL
jgi:hypothetical protein